MTGYLRVGRPWVLMMALATAIAVILAVWATAASAAHSVVYSEDFEGAAVGTEWSSTGSSPVLSATPSNRGFLGVSQNNLGFSNETVTLSLDLDSHASVTISFDGYFINSWDGNGDSGNGPDIFNLNVYGSGSDLLNTTFSNTGNSTTQAYPGTYPGASNASGTGAAESDTLGYATDSVYNFCFTFPHAGSVLMLHFSASGLQGQSDESWGLDNVVVETDSVCTGSTKLWNAASLNTSGSFTILESRSVIIDFSAGDTAVLSSTSDGTGPILADNFILVNGFNICPGG